MPHISREFSQEDAQLSLLIHLNHKDSCTYHSTGLMWVQITLACQAPLSTVSCKLFGLFSSGHFYSNTSLFAVNPHWATHKILSSFISQWGERGKEQLESWFQYFPCCCCCLNLLNSLLTESQKGMFAIAINDLPTWHWKPVSRLLKTAPKNKNAGVWICCTLQWYVGDYPTFRLKLAS